MKKYTRIINNDVGKSILNAIKSRYNAECNIDSVDKFGVSIIFPAGSPKLLRDKILLTKYAPEDILTMQNSTHGRVQVYSIKANIVAWVRALGLRKEGLND